MAQCKASPLQPPGTPPDKRYLVERMRMTHGHHDKVRHIKTRLATIKSALVKSTIQNEPDLLKLEDEMELQYNDLYKEIEDFFAFATVSLDGILNVPLEAPPAETLTQDPKKPGAPTKAAPAKKGGKDEVMAYESPLEPSPGGIESLVLLLDSSFLQIPIEYLKVFSLIPAISRDFSFQHQGRRLRSIQFQPTLNNAARNVEKDKTKYMMYDFKTDDPDVDINKYNASYLLSEITK
jgi:hypothetical protein